MSPLITGFVLEMLEQEPASRTLHQYNAAIWRFCGKAALPCLIMAIMVIVLVPPVLRLLRNTIT